MRTRIPLLRISFLFLLFIFAVPNVNGQIWKKIKKRSEKAAEEAIIRKTEEKVYKETSKRMDSVLNPDTKKQKRKNPSPDDPQEQDSETPGNSGDNEGVETSSQPTPESIKVYSKFDFVPGDKLLFFDDFSNDYVGDFPSKWNTNGSGEIVTVNNSAEKWFEIKAGYGIVYIPDTPALPEEYTVEFDLMTQGTDRQTSSTAILKVGVSDEASYKWGNYANVDIPFCQYHPVGFFVRNGGDINNKIDGDIREKVLRQPHISIAVNKQRFRLWVDESKYLDIPRMIAATNKPIALKFELRNFKDGKERLFIRNVKVAEGGQDLRRKLLNEGKISTNAILFDSGSANLLPQSMGVIRQISQVLQQENSLKLKIVGHTDAEGDDTSNLDLSKRRAGAVKNSLVAVYGIDASRLLIEGKGEAVPVADNSTANGKAQNRRVEFIKM